MKKIFVKLVSPRGNWEEDGKVLGSGDVTGFWVNESQRVKDAIKANVLTRVRAEDVPSDGPEEDEPQ